MILSQASTLVAQFATRTLPIAAAAVATSLPLFAQESSGGTSSSALDVFTKSGAIGILIIVLSVVALAVIIENMVTLKRDKLAPPELIDEVQALFDEGQYQEAMELCENEPCFFTRIAGAGITKVGHQFEVIEQSITEMGDEESIRLHQKIGWLALIALSVLA